MGTTASPRIRAAGGLLLPTRQAHLVLSIRMRRPPVGYRQTSRRRRQFAVTRREASRTLQDNGAASQLSLFLVI